MAVRLITFAANSIPYRMSGRNKLQKFAEVLQMPNVYESFEPTKPELTGQGGTKVDLAGRWAAKHFGNDRPITLELACGRGEYTLDLARQYPDRNFIGVDVKGARIWKGAKTALAEGLDNAAFLRTRIEVISRFFAPGEVSEIWITFPDPFLKKGKENRRLTAAQFLRQYRQLLQPEGVVHLKTDSRDLYDWTHATFAGQPAIDVLYHTARHRRPALRHARARHPHLLRADAPGFGEDHYLHPLSDWGGGDFWGSRVSFEGVRIEE